MQSGERFFLDGGFHLKLLINLVVKTQNTAEIKSTLRATYNSYNVMLNILTVIFFWVCLYMDVCLQSLWWAGTYLYWACGCNNPIHRGFREGIKRPVRPPHEIWLEKVPGRTEARLFYWWLVQWLKYHLNTSFLSSITGELDFQADSKD